MRIAILFVFLYKLTFDSLGQENISSVGSLPCVNYTSKDYKGGAQVFRGYQDTNGLISIVNTQSFATYDGIEWRSVGLDNITAADVLKLSSDSIIISHSNGLSLSSFDAFNRLNGFIPMSQFENKDIVGVKNFLGKLIIVSTDEIFYCSRDFKIIDSFKSDNISSCLIENGLLYFINDDKGLYTFNGQNFKPYISLKQFDNVNYAVVLNFKDQIYLVTDSKGIFKIENDTISNRVYFDPNISIQSILNIDDKYVSIGTFSQGVKIVNDDFMVEHTLTPEKGLNNGSIKKQFTDREGSLWLCTSNGLSKVDVMSPTMPFDYLFSDATVEALSEYKNEIVLATGGGSFSILQNGEIRKNTSILNDCYGQDVLEFQGDTSMFISGLYGVYQYEGDNQATLISEGGPYQVAKWSGDSTSLYILNYDGLQKLRYSKGVFKEVGYIKNFSEGEPYNFVIEDDGTIWIGTKPDDGVYKTHVDIFDNSKIGFERLYTDNGIPLGPCYLTKINNEIFLGTENGLLKYNRNDLNFHLFNAFDYDFSKEQVSVHRVNQDHSGNIWMVLYFNRTDSWEVGYAAPTSQEIYTWHSESFLEYNEEAIHSIYHAGKGVTWLGGLAGIIRFDMKNVRNNDLEFDALIRGVYWGRDTVFGGYGEPAQDFIYDYDSKKQIKFNFASNSFREETKILYSYKLEGYDEEWSEWSRKTEKEYTLFEGNYTFKVKAKSIYGVASSEDEIQIQILPPWYRTNWAYILFFVLAAIFVYIIIRLALYRAKQQNIRLEKIIKERTEEVVAQKDEAEKQKHLVEEKNLEILDSIAYAKRLQDAILTPIDLIQETFTDSFILFLPKDIVAGDFYWTNFSKLNSRDKVNLIAAADCTGHGVPGAMVSVVCSNALDRAAKEFGLQNPGKILDKVTSLVIETFEKSVDAVKDGMDIALSSFEQMDDYVELTYAGANNPAWIVSKNETLHVNNETNEAIMNLEGYFLFEIKATKQPVGNYANIKPFESHSVKLTKGDAVYMFTDGYADQFGGEKGKKYKYKPFKRLILSIQNHSMDEQNKMLNKEFIDWQGEHEQIDDVCVIGVKI
jgi:serine phosphatase RsbU (regulator of sigma subunit)/ligand-binding sensor domain-containing protein